MMLSLACVNVESIGLPSVEMWVDHGEDRCCGMVETVGIRQEMLFVMLESAKDQVLAVDTPGQQVLPHLWYGMACFLIRAAIGCESCSELFGKMQNVI
jgi:hypothetical protein